MFNGLPIENILEIIKKTNIASFCRLRQTCKWINELIDKNSKRIKIYPRSGEITLFLDITLGFNGFTLTLWRCPEARTIEQVLCREDYKEETKKVFKYFIEKHSLNLFVLNEIDLTRKHSCPRFVKVFPGICQQYKISCYRLKRCNGTARRMKTGILCVETNEEREWYSGKCRDFEIGYQQGTTEHGVLFPNSHYRLFGPIEEREKFPSPIKFSYTGYGNLDYGSYYPAVAYNYSIPYCSTVPISIPGEEQAQESSEEPQPASSAQNDPGN